MFADTGTMIRLLEATNAAADVSMLAERAAPVLGEYFGTPSAFFCKVRGPEVQAIGGTCEMSRFTNGGYRHYMARDPLLAADLASPDTVVRASTLVDYRALSRTHLYDACYRAHGVSRILFCKLDPRADGVERLGFVCMRATGDVDFTEGDAEAMRALRPVLNVAWRRMSEAQRMAEAEAVFDAVLAGADPRPRIVYQRGRCVWASRAAREALGARLPERGPSAAGPGGVVLERSDGSRVRGSVYRSHREDEPTVVVLDLFDEPSPRARHLAEEAGLTLRETQVLDALALGLSTERIANSLYISSHTVRTHVKRVLAKVGVHSRADLHALFEGYA